MCLYSRERESERARERESERETETVTETEKEREWERQRERERGREGDGAKERKRERYIYTHVFLYTYIYVEREGERERGGDGEKDRERERGKNGERAFDWELCCCRFFSYSFRFPSQAQRAVGDQVSQREAAWSNTPPHQCRSHLQWPLPAVHALVVASPQTRAAARAACREVPLP